MFHDHLAQRALRPLAAADAAAHLTRDRGVVEHAHVRVEQREFFRRQRRFELFANIEDVVAHRGDRAIEQHQFDRHVVGFAVRHALEDRRGMNDDGGADADAGRAGHADEARVHALRRTVAEVRDVTGGLGVRNDAGQLRRQRHEKRFLALVEAAPVALLHDEHAEYAALLDDRDA